MFVEVSVFKKVQADDGCPKLLSIHKEDVEDGGNIVSRCRTS